MTSSEATNPNWKNVNNWHWIEKDCTNWAHEHLKGLLRTVSVSLKNQKIKVKNVSSVVGDVSVNVRKGRIRQIYDLTIEISIEIDEVDEYSITIADYMSDTEYSDFEFVAKGLEAPEREALRKAFWEKLLEFRKDVEEIQGKGLLINAPGPEQETQTKKEKFNGVFLEDKNDINQSDKTNLEERIELTAPIEEVFSSLTDANKIMIWSRASSQNSNFSVGSKFSLFNGNVIGLVKEVIPNEKIVMDWKLKNWTDNSIVTINFKDKNGSSLLNLKQVGIPKPEFDSVKDNWHRYYWDPIKTLLGCSSTFH